MLVSMIIIIALLAFIIYQHIRNEDKCLQSRIDGCDAITVMVMDRAGDHGYDKDKIWKDLLQ